MKPLSQSPSLVLCATFSLAASIAYAQPFRLYRQVPSGKGEAKRLVLTYDQLFSGSSPTTPVDDTNGFAIPADAAEPVEAFEGTLTLRDPEGSGNFTLHSDIFHIVRPGDSDWKHLPAFSYRFIQSETYLIPEKQGLIITGSGSWNYILGTGRVWQEIEDHGYMRASLPFALVQRNQNCVHNGEMSFLFSNKKSPNISNVYYQITEETCYPMKFDLWGSDSASYIRGALNDS